MIIIAIFFAKDCNNTKPSYSIKLNINNVTNIRDPIIKIMEIIIQM
jgi:hypothetical protein